MLICVKVKECRILSEKLIVNLRGETSKLSFEAAHTSSHDLINEKEVAGND